MLHHFNKLLDRLQAQDEALRESNRKLEEQSERDPLTGIYNRRYLERHLAASFQTCRRMRRELAVAMIDVDAGSIGRGRSARS